MTQQIRTLHKKILHQLPYWIAACLTALIAVAYAKIFALCEEWALSREANVTLWLAPLGILISFLVGYFVCKEATGSGIPQILAAAEISDEQSLIVKKLLSLRMIITKVIGSCFCVLGGGSTGREGPTLQISAAVFYQLNRFWPKKLSTPSQSLMIISGGAAGLAAAFNTPLGGVVFAIEEIAKTHISFIRTSVFQAVIISGIISQAVMGNYLYIGKSSFDTSTVGLILYTVLFSVVIGIIGALFAESLYRIGRWRKRTTFSKQLILTLVSLMAFSGIFYFCGSSTLGAGKVVMQNILKGDINPDLSVQMWIGRLFGNFFTYIAGVVGGIFAPSLASGATLAYWLTNLLHTGSMHVLVLVGMVAFLTGVTRTPFTSFILVFEMTSSHEIILYLMLAGFVASLAARIVNQMSFYEQVAHDIKAS